MMMQNNSMQEPHIRNLQTMLRQLSRVDSAILPVIPDGIYGSNTYASVLSFQESRKLPQTGTADLQTWAALVHAYDESVPQRTMPSVLFPWDLDQTVQPGQFSYHIYPVQAMLHVLSGFFSHMPTVLLSGVLDEPTANSLMQIQTASGLPATGILDTATWYYLNLLYRTMTKNGKEKGTA